MNNQEQLLISDDKKLLDIETTTVFCVGAVGPLRGPERRSQKHREFDLFWGVYRGQASCVC